MTQSITVPEIADLLRRDAEGIARKLLPQGHFDGGGHEWKCKGRNSPTGDAISVHIGQGPKRGVCGFWNGKKRGGDLLDLIEVVNGGSKKEAVDWAKQWLGIAAGAPIVRQAPEERRAARLKADARIAANRAHRLSTAKGIWQSTEPLSGPAAHYLASRGIEPGYADAEIRAHRGIPHPEGASFPALVARVSDRAGGGLGVWRIYVKADGSGKAPVKNAKLGLGDVKGGAVRIGGIWSEIGIAEGLETALACRQIIHQSAGITVPVWAALSTSGMRGIELPEGIERVRIFADADPIKFRPDGKVNPSPGLEAAEALRERLEASGIGVTIEAPPTGLDWLDVLQTTEKREAA